MIEVNLQVGSGDLGRDPRRRFSRAAFRVQPGYRRALAELKLRVSRVIRSPSVPTDLPPIDRKSVV